MWVKAVRSFTGNHQDAKYRVEKGDVFDMPKGPDWLKVGLVVKASRDEIKAQAGKPEGN